MVHEYEMITSEITKHLVHVFHRPFPVARTSDMTVQNQTKLPYFFICVNKTIVFIDSQFFSTGFDVVLLINSL